MKVPVLDLKAQYAGIKAEIDDALARVCESAWFALGPEVEAFEKEWAEYCEAEHCVAVHSGTSALHLALLACGVGEGDEVITSPLTFFATAEAVIYTGARPVFADVDPQTFCLDPARVEELITEKTKAVMPVHLFGHPADVDALREVCERHGLALIADACQAHGAEYKRKRVGGLCDAGTFSFYVTKNLGAYGEGGAVVTNDPEIHERVRVLRVHGQTGSYRHEFIGFNYRMSAFQGAVLRTKLPYLDDWNSRRWTIAMRYADGLAGTPLVLPQEADYARSVWHLYVVRSAERDALKEHLAEREIATVVHYPVLMPDLDALKAYAPRTGPLDEARKATREVLSLPLFPEMTDEQVDYVVEQVKGFYA
jgi:dTDP-4-amino-4,6-dideoxygalactose transaminase